MAGGKTTESLVLGRVAALEGDVEVLLDLGKRDQGRLRALRDELDRAIRAYPSDATYRHLRRLCGPPVGV